jgi:predicted phage gp36 major capsid-like protein
VTAASWPAAPALPAAAAVTTPRGKKLKDGQGRPLWRPGVTGGDPSDILGYGYTVNQPGCRRGRHR